MAALQDVHDLMVSGQYGAALRALDGRTGVDRFTSDLLRLELLERLGEHAEARALVQQLARRRALLPGAKSICEFVLGRIEWDAGDTDSAVLHFQRAVTLATQCPDSRGPHLCRQDGGEARVDRPRGTAHKSRSTFPPRRSEPCAQCIS